MQRVPKTVAAPPATTTEIQAPAATEMGNIFLAGFASEAPDNHVPQAQPASGGRVPYLGFFHPKSGSAAEITEACKTEDLEVGVGMPFLGNVEGPGFVRIDAAGFVIWGQHVPYWCTTDTSNNVVEAWLEPQAVFEDRVDKKTGKPKSIRRYVDGNKMHGSCLAMILILPGRKPLPEALAPATLAIADVQKNHQSSSILRAFDNAQKAKDPAYAKTLGEIVSKAPPGLRVVSRFLITPKTGEVVWATADSAAKPLTMDQLAAVQAWGTDAALQDERERVEEIFETRVAAIKQKAAETAERGL